MQEDKKIRETVVKILLYIIITLTIISGLAWFSNLIKLFNWNFNYSSGEAFQSAVTVLDWTGIKFSSFFNKVSVDYSTVTTFIPFSGFFLLSLGFKKILKMKDGEVIPSFFPFFSSYNAAVIALGLIGTVWGLIMIGYGDLENFDLTQLTNALHTSLFSTLIALIWVFIIVTPVTKFMQWMWYGLSSQKEIAPTSENVIKEMTDFAYALSAANRGLKEFSENTNTGTFQSLTKSLEISVEQRELIILKLKEYLEYQKNILNSINNKLSEDERTRRLFSESLQMIKESLGSITDISENIKETVRLQKEHQDYQKKILGEFTNKLDEEEKKRIFLEAGVSKAAQVLLEIINPKK